jgi:hypothetical protein
MISEKLENKINESKISFSTPKINDTFEEIETNLSANNKNKVEKIK